MPNRSPALCRMIQVLHSVTKREKEIYTCMYVYIYVFLMTLSRTLALEGLVSNKQCQLDRAGNYIAGVYCTFVSPHTLQHLIRY